MSEGGRFSYLVRYLYVFSERATRSSGSATEGRKMPAQQKEGKCQQTNQCLSEAQVIKRLSRAQPGPVSSYVSVKGTLQFALLTAMAETTKLQRVVFVNLEDDAKVSKVRLVHSLQETPWDCAERVFKAATGLLL